MRDDNKFMFICAWHCRFTVTSARTSNDDILKDWAEVRKVSSDLLDELNVKIGDRAKVPLKGIH